MIALRKERKKRRCRHPWFFAVLDLFVLLDKAKSTEEKRLIPTLHSVALGMTDLDRLRSAYPNKFGSALGLHTLRETSSRVDKRRLGKTANMFAFALGLHYLCRKLLKPMEFVLEERVEKARDLFRQGYNCSQSVLLAYSDLLGVDSKLAATFSGPLGGGMGRLRRSERHVADRRIPHTLH